MPQVSQVSGIGEKSLSSGGVGICEAKLGGDRLNNRRKVAPTVNWDVLHGGG